MKKRYWTLAILAIVAIAVWHVSRHVSPGPAFGTSLQGENAAPSASAERRSSFRVGAFNIHGGKGRDGQRNLHRVADCVKNLDFVGLSEVLAGSVFGTPDQAEQLGRQLGLQWLFAPADGRWYGEDSGNGLLSRLPVQSWQRMPLPRRYDRGYRNMLLAEVDFGNGRTVRMLLTHVNRRSDAERKLQLAAVISLFRSLAEPAVLLGDLNSDAGDSQVRGLLARPGVIDAIGEKLGSKAPADRIDWIIARGLHCRDAGMRDEGISDHPLVWATLDFPDSKITL